MAESNWRCPSNIALVKYWGKQPGGIQIPANPSISLNLNELYAETKITISHGNVSGKPAFTFLFHHKPQPSFTPKLSRFFEVIWGELSVVRNHHLHIESSNNFPHGAGIASSAAGFGALALCLCDLEMQEGALSHQDFKQKASLIARLGSGSACRSIHSGPVIWGETEVATNSSNLYAVPFETEIHSDLSQLMDAVLLVDEGEKSVSSTAGHGLLDSNPYAEVRYGVARKNLKRITDAMVKGNVRSFISIVESEALQLHAMMMASNPYYILMKPGTLSIISAIWKYREETGIPVMFTLDAGANVHLLYSSAYNSDIVNFIESTLLPYCQNGRYLCTATGKGPQKL